MGLIVNGSFTTAEGIPYTSVYVKIHTVICEFANADGSTVNVSVHALVFLNRERRYQGFAFAMPSPPFDRIFGFTIPTSELETGFLMTLYSRYKARLEAQGFTVEDVLEPTPGASLQSSESTQTTLPTPLPPSEPAPEEPQPEPQPQSSSEYAPAPEATEA